ncbi:hypothetical protein I2I05_12845 [Hymenobacter sp. BT683]|uniref:DUF4034 domain-containing protein n=1 Tax=Hymenobacter jeongseonensis TaxID=2791027 RepID=A0ABS0IIV9_9BACT|nr:hypothetical protein [Hymenobacter jeongseonensis]MBF9238285.1 hypothetical protein [Hymenobacter jeongseonensis]
MLVLYCLPMQAQGWDVLPEYTFRLGGRAQVRRIILREDYDKPSPGFVKLRDSTSVEQLVKLTRRHNPAMQLYAAMALADRHYARLHEIFAWLIRKDRPISYQYHAWGADRVNYLHASEQLYHRIRNAEAAARSHRQPGFPSQADSLLYHSILHRMDSTALRLANEGEHVHYTLLENCLEDNNAYPGSYEDVRKLCSSVDPQQEQNRGYAAALAAYRREPDLNLLLRFDHNAFPAVARFPHPAFWPLIAKYRLTDKGNSRYEYYEAVAAFNNVRAVQLLDSLVRFEVHDENSAINMANSLEKAPISAFQAVVEQLWVQHHTSRLHLVSQLIQRNPRQAAKTFAEGFLNYKPDDQGRYGPSYERGTDSVASTMLRTIWQQDSAAFRRVAQHGVQVFRWSELTALCQLDKRYNFPWLRPLLVAELRTTRRPFDQYVVASALLNYSDAATNTLVKQALTENAVCQTADDTWCKSLRAQLERLNASGLSK